MACVPEQVGSSFKVCFEQGARYMPLAGGEIFISKLEPEFAKKAVICARFA
jgi:hypothetical protein